MPIINFKYSDLCTLLGENISQKVLIEKLPLIGADMHDVEGNSDEMSVEFFPDRPDLYSVEGLARSLKAFLDINPGYIEYEVTPTELIVNVDESVKEVRPYILCAALFDIKIDDAFLKSIIELQEKLHITIGRKRSKLAIGIHDLDKIEAPFTYKAVSPEDVSFIPLAKNELMSLNEILITHEKGIEYAHLLEGKNKYPLIVDKNDNVISFPPIINSTLTTVNLETKNLFIDVTGVDLKVVRGALNIIITSLAERGGKIGSVKMKGSIDSISPDLSCSTHIISIEECEKFIGVKLGPNGLIESINKMGMNAFEAGEDKIKIEIPPTRLDIMHDVDLFEDVAIGYGFERFGGDYSSHQTYGQLLPDTSFSERTRDIMIGLGFTEVTTLTLSNDREEFQISGLPKIENVKVSNPITEHHTCLRSYLMPSLMRIFQHNKHRDLPQKIFEIGYVIRDNKIVPHLCALVTASKTSFTEIKSISESIMREMSCDVSISSCDYPTYIEGRGAFLSRSGQNIGTFGEVSPKVIVDFEITHPIIMLELDLSSIIKEKAVSLF